MKTRMVKNPYKYLQVVIKIMNIASKKRENKFYAFIYPTTFLMTFLVNIFDLVRKEKGMLSQIKNVIKHWLIKDFFFLNPRIYGRRRRHVYILAYIGTLLVFFSLLIEFNNRIFTQGFIYLRLGPV